MLEDGLSAVFCDHRCHWWAVCFSMVVTTQSRGQSSTYTNGPTQQEMQLQSCHADIVFVARWLCKITWLGSSSCLELITQG
jgi:hypothetical protein